LIAAGTIGACTQDFGQFDPDSSGSGASTSSSSSSTSSTGGGGTGGATTTTSTNPGGEDCLNGEDDNGNGSIDCADPECADFECVGVPATGSWMGPGILYDGDPGMVPDCPPDFPNIAYEGSADPIQEAAVCSQCTCAPNVTCNAQVLVAHGNAGCAGASENEAQPAVAGMCLGISVGGGTSSYDASSPIANAMSCAAAGGMPTLPPPQWQRAARICSVTLSGAGCGAADEVCVPTAVTAPFEGRVCIWVDADVNCPSAYPDRHEFSTTVNDTRGCTGCSCSNPGSASCTVTTTIYSDVSCTTAIGTVANNGTACLDAGPGQSITVAKTTMGGACNGSGGQPTGSIGLGQDRMTVCCR
jgi:hypothetical protein